MLCSRFERMSRGKMYGGACTDQQETHVECIAGSSAVLHIYLGHTIASHCRTQGAQIHDGECALRDEYVCSLARDDVESIVYEQMRRGVDQWTWAPDLVPKTRNRRTRPTCVALDERVVALAIPILLNLLHVGSPVDLGVCSRRQLHVFKRGAEGASALSGKTHRVLSR